MNPFTAGLLGVPGLALSLELNWSALSPPMLSSGAAGPLQPVDIVLTSRAIPVTRSPRLDGPELSPKERRREWVVIDLRVRFVAS